MQSFVLTFLCLVDTYVKGLFSSDCTFKFIKYVFAKLLLIDE